MPRYPDAIKNSLSVAAAKSVSSSRGSLAGPPQNIVQQTVIRTFESIANFRAAPPLGDRTVFAIIDQGVWLYRTDVGANVTDDGASILRPNSVGAAENGRGYRITDVGTFAPVSYGPTSVPADGARPWITTVVLPAPATNQEVYDYVVRVHGFHTDLPVDDWFVEECVVVRVTRNSGNSNTSMLTHECPFNSPDVRLYRVGLTIAVQVRAHASYNFTWSAVATRSAVPFQQKLSKAPTAIGTGSAWVDSQLSFFLNNNGDQMMIDYAVFGRYTPGSNIWSFLRAKGTAVLTKSANTITINDTQTITSTQVRFALTDPVVSLQFKQHATDNWTFSADATVRLVGV